MSKLTNTIKAVCTGQPQSIEVMIAKGEEWAQNMMRSIELGEKEVAEKREKIVEMETELSAMQEVVKRGKRIHEKFTSFFE
ncbi:hypothetical protein VmeM32_00221 [Vibrio phage vB_VmeM-32]|nr:hypothetical protein VmeM32_00221 [Vibrio phage vB_VmeM-32]